MSITYHIHLDLKEGWLNRTYVDDNGLFHNEPIINKEAFIACYNAWIKPKIEEGKNGETKQGNS